MKWLLYITHSFIPILFVHSKSEGAFIFNLIPVNLSGKSVIYWIINESCWLKSSSSGYTEYIIEPSLSFTLNVSVLFEFNINLNKILISDISILFILFKEFSPGSLARHKRRKFSIISEK